jgi:hypothetical protein
MMRGGCKISPHQQIEALSARSMRLVIQRVQQIGAYQLNRCELWGGGGMTIVFDPARRRSTHVESGLAVQWVREEPPLERRDHFKLIVAGTEVPFEASYDYGEDKINKQYPSADTLERGRLVMALREINYRAVNIKGTFDKGVFVAIWQDLVQQGLDVYRASTSYTEFAGSNPSGGNTWECRG